MKVSVACFFYDFKKSLSQQECIVWLHEVFGNEAPSEKTVYNSFAEFHPGHEATSDVSHEGQPKSVVISSYIDAVHKMIEEDWCVTYCEIEAPLDISQTAIYSVLHEHLAVKKICYRWIPKNLTDQKEACVNWCKKMLKKFKLRISKSI